MSNRAKSKRFPLDENGSETQYGRLVDLWDRDGDSVEIKAGKELQKVEIRFPYAIAFELTVNFLRNVAMPAFGKQSEEYEYVRNHLIDDSHGTSDRLTLHIKPLVMTILYTTLLPEDWQSGLLDLAGREKRLYKLIRQAFRAAGNNSAWALLDNLKKINQRLDQQNQLLKDTQTMVNANLMANSMMLIDRFHLYDTDKPIQNRMLNSHVKVQQDFDQENGENLELYLNSNKITEPIENAFINSSKTRLAKKKAQKYGKV